MLLLLSCVFRIHSLSSLLRPEIDISSYLYWYMHRVGRATPFWGRVRVLFVLVVLHSAGKAEYQGFKGYIDI